MNKGLTLKGTSLVIESDLDNRYKLIDTLQNEGINLSDNILPNQSNHFIFSNEFINLSTNLTTVLRKFDEKNYNNELKVYITDSNEFKIIKTNSNDTKKYKKILSQNNLDGEIREFDISVNIMHEVLDKSIKSRTFLDILILLALANKCKYDAENLEAKFSADETCYTVETNIIKDDFVGLYPIYNWIINDNEYEDSYSVKLQIVRKVIATKQNIKDVEGILKDSKLAYKRIISKKTDDYFEQLNHLKDDFLLLSQNENTTLRTLHVTFFAWIGYLGIELFNIITKYDGKNILHYLFCSQGSKKAIVILMFIVALIIIFMGYISEVRSLKKTYTTIKGLYKDKILFETNSVNESKFEMLIEEPEVGKIQKSIFIILMITLIVRLCVALI